MSEQSYDMSLTATLGLQGEMRDFLKLMVFKHCPHVKITETGGFFEKTFHMRGPEGEMRRLNAMVNSQFRAERAAHD